MQKRSRKYVCFLLLFHNRQSLKSWIIGRFFCGKQKTTEPCEPSLSLTARLAFASDSGSRRSWRWTRSSWACPWCSTRCSRKTSVIPRVIYCLVYCINSVVFIGFVLMISAYGKCVKRDTNKLLKFAHIMLWYTQKHHTINNSKIAAAYKSLSLWFAIFEVRY